jgi:hypothetical protein
MEIAEEGIGGVTCRLPAVDIPAREGEVPEEALGRGTAAKGGGALA